jgi:GxxExxY protein
LVTGHIIDAAMKVHSVLGPGLLESAYEECLQHELEKRGMIALSQVKLPIVYDEITIDVGYRMDLLVEDKVVVELKAVKDASNLFCAAAVIPETEREGFGAADKLSRNPFKRWYSEVCTLTAFGFLCVPLCPSVVRFL